MLWCNAPKTGGWLTLHGAHLLSRVVPAPQSPISVLEWRSVLYSRKRAPRGPIGKMTDLMSLNSMVFLISRHVLGALAGSGARSSGERRVFAWAASALLLASLPAIPASTPTRVHLTTALSASSGWLDRFNNWRGVSGQSPLTENASWSGGDYNHAVYMVKNNLVTHSETAGVPYYTASGATEAQDSNIFVSSSTATTDPQAIDWWMGAPFHAMAMMDPRLTQTGFGSYRDTTTSPWQMGAALDVVQGNSLTGGQFPVFFPGNQSTEPLTAYSGNEFPDPTSACPGYAGLPVFIEVGANVSSVATVHTITANGALLDTCAIDSSNTALSSYLKQRGGVIVMPRAPLQTGTTYTVALTVNAVPYTWSFTVGALRPEPASWQLLGGGLTSSPAPTSSGATSEDVFVRGTDSQMWSIHWNGTAFGSFLPRGGVLTADPGAVAQTTTKTDVFVRGTDNQLWTIESNSGSFGNWTPLGGGLTSGPAADAWTTTGVHVDVYVRGTDGQLWHKWADNGNWAGWEPLGGGLGSNPGAVSWGPRRADVFVRGTDGQLWHKWYDGIAWRPWEPLGGGLSSAPDPASCSSGHLDVFVIGTDGQLWRKGFNGSAWLPWQPLGGDWTAAPGAVCRPGTNTIDVFGRGTDNALWTESVPGS